MNRALYSALLLTFSFACSQDKKTEYKYIEPGPEAGGTPGATLIAGEEEGVGPSPEGSGLTSETPVAATECLSGTEEDCESLALPLYPKAELDAVREVFADLGELTIDPAHVATEGGPSVKSQTFDNPGGSLPWAAYWYPKRGKELFLDEKAPLSKLDAYLGQSDIKSSATVWESENYSEFAADWEGLCDSWAMAAVLTVEPKAPQQISGIDFSVSDLKALAIKYFEGYKSKIYGRRYLGISDTDGQIQDLRPEAFHRIVEEYIGKRKQAIIVDEDPGPELWSKPLFRMAYSMKMDPERKNAILVKAYPWMIRQRFAVDEVSTTINGDLAAPLYEYRLYFDSNKTAEGRYKILAGEWIGASQNSHPDMVFLPIEPRNQDQINPEIKRNHEEIRKLLVKAGMFKS